MAETPPPPAQVVSRHLAQRPLRWTHGSAAAPWPAQHTPRRSRVVASHCDEPLAPWLCGHWRRGCVRDFTQEVTDSMYTYVHTSM